MGEDMKKNELNKDFLMNKLCEEHAINTELEWSEIFKQKLKAQFEMILDDKELLEDEDYINSLNEIRDSIDWDGVMTYEEYNDYYTQINGEWDSEFYDEEYRRYEFTMKDMEVVVSRYANIINRFPENIEFELECSRRSWSIYLITNLPAIKSNRELFTNGQISYLDRYEEYTEDELKDYSIKIRLSDHVYDYADTCIDFFVGKRNQ